MPIASNITAGVTRVHVLRRVEQLTCARIDPCDFAVVAAHEPQLAARWLQHAYRIAALDDLSSGYTDALDLVRDDLIGAIRNEQWRDQQVDATACWLGQIAGHAAHIQAALHTEIATFLTLSRQIAASNVYDLVGSVPGRCEAA